MTFEAQRLTPDHSFDFFDCGEQSLTEWPQRHALKDQEQGVSATHVWVDEGGCYVLGYFTLLPTITRVDDGAFSALKPKRFQGKELPGVLIGKLGLDQSLRGSGHGLQLVAEAVVVAGEAMSLIGGMHVVVDPMSGRERLRQWYLDQGFGAIEGSDRLLLGIR